MDLTNIYLKPILAIEKSLFNSTELNRLYYLIYSDFMTPGDSVVIRNCVYHYIDLGLYLGLDHNELFTVGEGFQLDTDSRKFFRVKYQDSNSNPIDAEVHRRWDGTETAETDPYIYYFNNSLYKILQYNPGTIGRVVHPTSESSWEFEPIINPSNTTLRDACELNHKVLSYNLTCDLLEWMGFPDLHSHVTPDGLITECIDCGYLARVIGFSPETAKSIPNGDLGEFPTDLVTQLNNDLRELNWKLDSLSVPDIPSNESREVVEYGDIADYISLKTLVDVDVHEYIPNSTTYKLKNRNTIKYRDQDSTADPTIETVGSDGVTKVIGWDGSENKLTDHKLYMFRRLDHISVDRIIKLGALLEISILYKLTDGLRKNVTWNPEESKPWEGKSNIKAEDIPVVGDPDPWVYYINVTNNLHKLSFAEYDKDNPNSDPVISDIRMDGYHITFGDPEEYIYSELVYVKDSFIRLNNDFIIQITEDSIILYPQNPMIMEYYIKSCKILCTNDN